MHHNGLVERIWFRCRPSCWVSLQVGWPLTPVEVLGLGLVISIQGDALYAHLSNLRHGASDGLGTWFGRVNVSWCEFPSDVRDPLAPPQLNCARFWAQGGDEPCTCGWCCVAGAVWLTGIL